MKHITEAPEEELAQHFANKRVGGVALVPGVEDYAQARALRAAFDFSPIEHLPGCYTHEGDFWCTCRHIAPQTAEGVAELVEGLRVAMLGTVDGDMIDGDSEIPAGEMYRLAAEYITTALSASQRPTPSDEELLAAYDEGYQVVLDHGEPDDQRYAHIEALHAVAALGKGVSGNVVQELVDAFMSGAALIEREALHGTPVPYEQIRAAAKEYVNAYPLGGAYDDPDDTK